MTVAPQAAGLAQW